MFKEFNNSYDTLDGQLLAQRYAIAVKVCSTVSNPYSFFP